MNKTYIRKIFFTSSFLLLLQFSLSCSNGHPLSLRIENTDLSYPIVRYGRFFIDHENLNLEQIRQLPESNWKFFHSDHKHFGTGFEIIWLCIDLDNQSGKAQWNLVSEYSFIERISLFYFNRENRLVKEQGGAVIPMSQRYRAHRLPVLPLDLKPGKNRVWLRIQSRFEKKIGFTIEAPDKLIYRNRFSENFYLEFLRLASILAVISFLSSLYLRKILFLWHAAYVVSLTAYMAVWEGYAMFWIYPEHPYCNSHINYFSGFLFGFFLLQFWRRLLSLSIQLPGYNRVMIVLAWLNLASSTYALLPFTNFTALNIIARLDIIFAAGLVLLANYKIIKLGQRYAIYSMFSAIFFFSSFWYFLYHGIWMIPGNANVNNPLYLGFLLELIVLILSLLSRIRFIRSLQERGHEENRNTASMSRIQHFDLRHLIIQLDSLIKDQKIYCDENFSLESLAAALSITRHQLSELLREVFGTNFYGFLNNLRIREAQRLLRADKEISILAVSLAVGYNSKSTFNQAFKKNTGMTPSEFRRTNE